MLSITWSTTNHLVGHELNKKNLLDFKRNQNTYFHLLDFSASYCTFFSIHPPSTHHRFIQQPRPTSKPAGVNTFTVPAGTLRGSFSHFVVFSRSVPLMQVGLFRGCQVVGKLTLWCNSPLWSYMASLKGRVHRGMIHDFQMEITSYSRVFILQASSWRLRKWNSSLITTSGSVTMVVLRRDVRNIGRLVVEETEIIRNHGNRWTIHPIRRVWHVQQIGRSSTHHPLKALRPEISKMIERIPVSKFPAHYRRKPMFIRWIDLSLG